MSSGKCSVCNKPASEKCINCQNVWYCCTEHQSEDWPNHRRNCRLCKTKTSDNGGRYVVATKNIKKGSLFLREAPVILGPYPFYVRSPQLEQDVTSCVGCLRVLSSGSDGCPKCQWPACSEKCPGLTDPAFHGAECELLAPLKSKFAHHSLLVILPLRCLALQKTNPKKWNQIKKMAEVTEKALPHIKEYRRKNEGWVFLEEVLKSLTEEVPNLLPPDCGPETIKQLYSLLRYNILKSNFPGGGKFAGVFPVAGVIEHSCVPNARYLLEATEPFVDCYEELRRCRMWLVAKENISKGERVTVGLLDNIIMPCYQRQLLLEGWKNSQCSCARCLDPRELGTDLGTQKCSSCAGWVVPSDPKVIEFCDWKCLNCGKRITGVQALRICISLLDDVVNLRYQGNFTVESVAAVLAKLERFLHPNHSNCLDAKMLLIEIFKTRPQDVSALSDADLNKYADLCRDVLNFLLMPCLIVHAGFRVSDCLVALANINTEILKRKVESGKVDPSRAQIVQKYCSDLKSVADRLILSRCSDAELEALRGNNVIVSPF